MHIQSPSVEPPPNAPRGLPREWYIAQWHDLTDAAEQFLIAGLRREVGSTDELRAAYRRWYATAMEEHDRMLRRMLEELQRRGGHHGR